MPASAAEQRRELRRVQGKLAQVVLEFVSAKAGQQFTGGELERYVLERAEATPGSASRVMRELRLEGLIDVELVSRPRSLYFAPALPSVQGELFPDPAA